MKATESKALVYFRRLGGQPFPATGKQWVEVLTPGEWTDVERERAYEEGRTPRTEPRLGAGDGQWKEITRDEDDDDLSLVIDDALGLCGDLTEIWLLIDAMWISAAIHERLKLPLVAPGEDCMWRQSELDEHDEDTAERFFETIGKVYGVEAESAARRRYAA